MTTVIEIDALDSLDLCSTCENGFIKHFGLLKKVDEKCINTNKSTLHCSFCLNLLSSETIDHAVAIVRTLLSSSNLKSNDVVLESSYPRCLNIFRTLVYTRLHQHYKSSSDNSIPKIDKSLSLDHIFDSLFRQQWKESSSSSSAINVNKSIVRVGLSVTIDNQQLVLSTLASTLFPDIKLYERSKRKFNDVVVPIPTIEADHVDVNTEPMTVVNENDISNLVYEATLSSIKKKSAAEVEQLANQLVSLLSQIPQGNTVAGITQLNVSFSQAKFYLLGRYCKLSRDVPQSAWTMGGERKGRASVEEIICAQVKYGLRARLGNCGDCAMHACGREDIDVRCLGNGRPFALELTLAAHSIIDQSVLDEIRMQINDGVDSELNKEKDIQIPLLIKV